MARRRASKRASGMGTLYQRTPGGVWTAEYGVGGGKSRKRSTRTSDRQAALDILEKWTGIEAKRRNGMIDEAGERIAAEGKRGIEAQLAEWREWMESKGSTPGHVRHTFNTAERVLSDAKVRTLGGIVPSAILSAVAGLGEGGASARTKNHALGTVRALCRWAVHDGRMTRNPLAGMRGFNVEADRRKVRRALGDDELRALIDAATHGERFKGMSGPDRAMLYRLAAGSGLRRGEIASLTPESFQLDGDAPSVVVAAGHSKRRREDRQPIRADLADALAQWLTGKPKGERVFQGTMHRTGAMLRFDLRRAWQRWTRETPPGAQRREKRRAGFLREADDSGRVADFHSLRATYITSIVRGGASVKVSQTLARHSTPVLTMNVYTRLGVHDLTAGLDGLPTIDGAPKSDAAALRATGTDGQGGGKGGGNRTAKHSQSSPTGALRLADDASGGEVENTGKLRGNRTDSPSIAKQCKNAPRRTRTFDPLIKSQLLYQLS